MHQEEDPDREPHGEEGDPQDQCDEPEHAPGVREVEGPSEGGIALWHPEPRIALAGVATQQPAGPVRRLVPLAIVDVVLVHAHST